MGQRKEWQAWWAGWVGSVGRAALPTLSENEPFHRPIVVSAMAWGGGGIRFGNWNKKSRA